MFSFLRFSVLFFFCCICCQASNPENQVMAFQGKGTNLAWDVGVLESLWRNIPSFRNSPIILTGNSSGAIVTAYFACRGISEQTIQSGKQMLIDFPRDAINENNGRKAIELFLEYLKSRNYSDHSLLAYGKDLQEFGDYARGKKIAVPRPRWIRPS